MQILLNARCYNKVVIGEIIHACKSHNMHVVVTAFDGRNDIVIAHQILDSEVDTLFVITDGFDNNCPDLIARALLSNSGMILSRRTNMMNQYASALFIDVADIYTSISNLITNITEYPRMFTFKNEGPGTGAWDETVYLIVGERPGNKPSVGKKDAAFFSVESSSKWLREQINRLNFSQQQFYWVNAFDRGGVEIDWEFVDRLKPLKIFALGKDASMSLTKVGIDHEAIPHPQYWKRFKSKEEYPLISKLRELN